MVPAPKASFVLVNVGTEGDVDETRCRPLPSSTNSIDHQITCGVSVVLEKRRPISHGALYSNGILLRCVFRCMVVQQFIKVICHELEVLSTLC